MGGDATGWRLAALGGAWLGGVALQLQERALLPLGGYAACAAAGLAVAAAAWALGRRSGRGFVLVLLGVATVAFGMTGGRAALRLAEVLPAAFESEDVVVTGTVASLPQRSASGLRFRFEVESAQRRGQRVEIPAVLALGWYGGFHEDAVLTQPQTELRAGQRWRFTLRLRQPHGNLNPHGHDRELQLFEQGVRATGTVRDAPPPQRLGEAGGHRIERARQDLRDAIETRVPDRRAAGVLAALAVGDQSAIERDDWDLFRATGVAHLMSISGLHVTMFAWLAGGLIGWAWRRSPAAMLRLPAPLAAQWGGLAAACAYAVFCGWGVPAQRTVWMLVFVTVLGTLGIAWPWALVLLGAAVLVTALDPWALLQPGFWLSFAAVGLLMASAPATPAPIAFVPGWRGWPARLAAATRGGLRTQLVATVGLTPLGLLFFQQVSLVGLLANLAAIPLVTLAITPLALLGSVAAPLWSLAALLLQGLTAWLAALAALPNAVWVAPAAPAWAQAAGLLGALLLVLPLPWRLRLLAVPLALPMLLPPLERPAPGRFEVLAVDVGQGTAVLVRTATRLLVYDAGPQYTRDSDAGQRILLPLLRARGESTVDILLLSHRDADHVGGAAALLAGLPVGRVLSSLEPGHALLGVAPMAQRCEAGQAWDWDGVRFAVLHPPPRAYDGPARPNALSCVLKVSAADGRAVLIAGDIEREQELHLAATQPDGLRADVLIAPHHGSRTSSTAELLAAVAPQTAVFQAGYRNRYGHPAADVLARYRSAGIGVIASPRCGAWHWRSDRASTGVCERDVAMRYWHHRPAGGAD